MQSSCTSAVEMCYILTRGQFTSWMLREIKACQILVIIHLYPDPQVISRYRPYKTVNILVTRVRQQEYIASRRGFPVWTVCQYMAKKCQ